MTQFLNPFTAWWTFRWLFPGFSCHEQCCYKHLCTGIYVDTFLFHLGIYLRVETLACKVNLYLTIEESAELFSKWLNHFAFLYTMYKPPFLHVLIYTCYCLPLNYRDCNEVIRY